MLEPMKGSLARSLQSLETTEIAEIKISWPDFLSGKNQAKQSVRRGRSIDNPRNAVFEHSLVLRALSGLDRKSGEVLEAVAVWQS